MTQVNGSVSDSTNAVNGNNNGTGYGVCGTSQGNHGVCGTSTASANGYCGVKGVGYYGVYGEPDRAYGSGVWGHSTYSNSNGVAGTATVSGSIGVLGTSTGGNGIKGESGSAYDSGVWGNNTGAGYGVSGSTNSSSGNGTAGVWGSNASSGYGVKGTSSSGTAVYGEGPVGVKGYSTAAYGNGGRFDSVGSYSVALSVGATGTGSKAAVFSGNVDVQGTLTKSAGSFMIDHPLDPKNMYLSHSFVESDEMKNVYDGIATLDKDGKATVEFPNWFGALNENCRYTLTAIGCAQPDIHVSEEMNDGKFSIAGGIAGKKVSWQVTGVRKDVYAKAYPIQVEKVKEEGKKGYFTNPELWNL